MLASFRDRYFAEALPAAGRHDARTAQRLARALYPATLTDEQTLTATEQALGDLSTDDPVRAVLLEQGALLHGRITARAR